MTLCNPMDCSPSGSSVHEISPARILEWVVMLPTQEARFDPWGGKIPWRSEWQPTLVFLPVESHGQRSLTGYSPWGFQELDTTEAT